MEDRALYERQPSELDEAWAWWMLIRDMTPPRRMNALAEQISRQPQYVEKKIDVNSILHRLYDYSRQWVWRTRINEWDLELDRQYRKTLLEDRKNMARRHVKLSQGMQQLCGLGLKTMLDKAEAAGKKISISATDIKNLIALGVQIEREAVGEPGAIVEERHLVSGEEARDALRPVLLDKDARKAAKEIVARLNAAKQTD